MKAKKGKGRERGACHAVRLRYNVDAKKRGVKLEIGNTERV